MNSLGWSRRDPDVPVRTNPPSLVGRLQSLNPFGSGGYVRLPVQESPGAPLPAPNRREEEEGWLACKSLPFSGSGYSKHAALARCDKRQVPAWSLLVH